MPIHRSDAGHPQQAGPRSGHEGPHAGIHIARAGTASGLSFDPADFDAFAIAAQLASALDAAAVPYAIGGAIAYGVWGDPRGTHDVDINLFVRGAGLEPALDALARAGVEIDRKILSDLAVREPDSFKALVEQAQTALAKNA
mgnify:CR=1 FL=1